MSSGWEASPTCGSGNCLEVMSQVDGSVLIRDSKDRNGPWLQFTADEYKAHMDGIKADLQRKNTSQDMHMANLENLLIKLDRRLMDITVLVDEPCRTESDLRFMRTRLRALLGVGA